ncbi:MAG: hypothetical protein L0Y66_11820 [Myxococcaceae bacterium]|nr:hypothetical protein [Myxococcaceae bacterium]
MAICRYADTGAVYRFSCDRAWEVQDDSAYTSAEDAMVAASLDYDVTKVHWVRVAE